VGWDWASAGAASAPAAPPTAAFFRKERRSILSPVEKKLCYLRIAAP